MTALKLWQLFWFFCLFVTLVTSQVCPHGWVDKPGGPSCYMFYFKVMKTWSEARKACQQRDGDLLKLDNVDEKDFIIEQVKLFPSTYEWWTGLNNQDQLDTWRWADGQTSDSSIIRWGSGEPNNFRNEERCAEIWDNLFNDKNCEQPLQYICERPKSKPLTCDADAGWVKLEDGYCFKLFTDEMDRHSAIASCSLVDAELAPISGESVQHVTTELAAQSSVSVWLPSTLTSPTFWRSDTDKDDFAAGTKTIIRNVTSANVTTEITQVWKVCAVLNSSISDINNWMTVDCTSTFSFICRKPQGTCPTGWLQHQSTCVLLDAREKLTWNEAKGYCTLRGTTMLEMIKDSDRAFISSLLLTTYIDFVDSVWLGLSGTGDNWVLTTGGATGRPVDDSTSSTEFQCGYVNIDDVTGTSRAGDCGMVRGVVCTIPTETPVKVPPPLRPSYMCQHSGWHLHDNMCYRIHEERTVTWSKARELCREQGAQLASATSAEAMSFLGTKITQDAWLGYNDRETENRYVWLDQAGEVSFTYWKYQEPSNTLIGRRYSENCVAMTFDPDGDNLGKWMDYPCQFELAFVCQMDAEFNIALGKIATQSSNHGTDYASYGNDNCINYITVIGCCTHTGQDYYPWWQLDLGTEYSIGKIVIHRRYSESCKPCMSRMSDFRLFISNTSGSIKEDDMVFQDKRRLPPPMISLTLDAPRTGRFVRIDIPRREFLTLCEVQVFRAGDVRLPVLTTENSFCYHDSTTWSGTVSHTVSGRMCQAWVTNSPHEHTRHSGFVDGTDKEAKNYCRDPDGEGQIWCYTVDPNVRWEYCGVPQCSTIIDSGTITPPPVTDETETECQNGWMEDPNSGYCFKKMEPLSWADAVTECSLLESEVSVALALEEEFFKGQDGLSSVWLGLYGAPGDTWRKPSGQLSPGQTTYIKSKTAGFATAERQIKCPALSVNGSDSGQWSLQDCTDRKQFICKLEGKVRKLTTTESQMKPLEIDLKGETSFKFQFKGRSDATIMLSNTQSTTNTNNGYKVTLCGGLGYVVEILDTQNPQDKSRYSFGLKLCNPSSYTSFWISWKAGLTVGRGEEIGRNIMLTSDMVTSEIRFISVTSDPKGYWKIYPVHNPDAEPEAPVSIAQGKSTSQSSDWEITALSGKGVDGCSTQSWSSQCCSHTNNDFEPWWQVDLGRFYHISKVVIHRRWDTDCSPCLDRLRNLRLYISAFSDSTDVKDVVYKDARDQPPAVIEIPVTKGTMGRYVKIDVEGRKEYLTLCEVEVFEDVDFNECGPGWKLNKATGTCFFFHDIKKPWSEAREACLAEDGDLAIIESPEEQLYIYEQVKKFPDYGVWVGLHELIEGQWRGPGGEVLSYLDWATGEPNDWGSGEDCGALKVPPPGTARMNDGGCARPMGFVCKKKELPDQTTTTAPTTTTTGTTPTSATATTTTTTGTTPTSATATTTPTTAVGITTVPTTPQSITEGSTVAPTSATLAPQSSVSTAIVQSSPTNTLLSSTSSSTTVTGNEWSALCGPLWELGPSRDYCYMFVEDLQTWSDSENLCQESSGHLVSIVTVAEQFYIAGRLTSLKGAQFWIGANDKKLETGWRWSDGQPFTFIFWSPDEPNDYENSANPSVGEDCGAMLNNDRQLGSQWNDLPCSFTRGYICKKKAKHDVTSTFSPVSTTYSDNTLYGCPGHGWLDYRSSCYLTVEKSMDWSSALQYCRQNGGDLVSLNDEEEQNFVFSNLPQKNCSNIWKSNTDCAKWAETGECDINPVWMASNCQKDCQQCVPVCRNTHQPSSQCKSWAALKECEANPTWMLQNCAESCGICQGANGRGFWVGMSDHAARRQFTWSDYTRARFSNWGLGEPSGFSRIAADCVEISLMEGSWHTSDCGDTLMGFVCEQPKTFQSTTSPSPFKVGCDTNDSFGYGSYCYTFVKFARKWNDASAFCQSTGGQLVTIPDRFTQSFLASELVNRLQNYWIGVVSDGSDATSVTGSSLTYTHWDSNYAHLKNNAGCDLNWNLHPGTGQCFRLMTALKTWQDANDSCQQENAYLATIKDVAEQRYIEGLLTADTDAKGTWVDAQRSDTNSPWKWSSTSEQLNPTIRRRTGCPDGWYIGGSPGTCFYAGIESGISWRSAQDKCQALGGNLASIASAEDASFIKQMVSQWVTTHGQFDGLWIGGYDKTDPTGPGEGVWKNIDGTPWMSSIVTWGPHQPDNFRGIEDCVAVLTTSQWQGQLKDASCNWSGTKGYVCKLRTGIGNCGLVVRGTSNAGDLDAENCDTTLPYICQKKAMGDNYRKCVSMTTYRPIGMWTLEDCEDKRPSICQGPRVGFTTPTTTMAPTTEGISCPTGAMDYKGNCYIYSNDDVLSFFAARERCQSIGGDLPSINSAEENSKIREFLLEYFKESGAHAWLGINDVSNEGEFVWSDGSPVVYTGWRRSEPNNYAGNEDCAETSVHDGQWNDVSCYLSTTFICKRPKWFVAAQTTTVPVSTTPAETCDLGSDWLFFGGYCYYISPVTNELLQWYTAQAKCRGFGATLASVHSKAENNFLTTHVSKLVTHSAWLGSKMISSYQRQFGWSDETSFDFSVWVPNEPNGVTNECVKMLRWNGLWADEPCTTHRQYICKIQNGVTTPVQGETTPTTRMPACRAGFSLFGASSCFKLFDGDDATTFQEAYDVCRDIGEGYRLVGINSPAEKAFLSSLLRTQSNIAPIWVGLITVNGITYWTDLSKVRYGQWSHDNKTAQLGCAEMYTDRNRLGLWKEVHCSEKRGFICKGPGRTEDSSFQKTVLPSAGTADCIPGYTEIAGSCYLVNENALSWDEAQHSCKEFGSDLVTVLNFSNQLALDLLTNVYNTTMWLGFKYQEEQNRFVWINNQTATSIRWASQQTFYGASHKCVAVETDRSWTKTSCNDGLPSVCQRSSESSSKNDSASTTRSIPKVCRDPSWLQLGQDCFQINVEDTEMSSEAVVEVFCSWKEMKIASIHSFLENRRIWKRAIEMWAPLGQESRQKGIWLSIYPFTWEDDNMKWMDGSPVDFTHWDDGVVPPVKDTREPMCVFMSGYSGRWRLSRCRTRRGHICQTKADQSVPLESTTQPISSRNTAGQTGDTTMIGSTSTFPNGIPPVGRFSDNRPIRASSSLSGGQIAGIVVGVVGLVFIIGVAIYVIKKSGFRISKYTPSLMSHSFDNALYNKNKDSISLDESAS